jgi:hypothetical protein
MIVASFGGGVNSAAMVIGLWERGEPVDLILFADTGGEKPHTYDFLSSFSFWCSSRGLPVPEVVSNKSRKQPTLEADCLHYKRLPGIAYGFKSCSVEWKVKPIQDRLKGIEHTMLVGIDADEPHRAKNNEGYRYPLLEWEWGRAECEQAIARAGLKSPGKSACFFCPSSKKQEIFELRRMLPGSRRACRGDGAERGPDADQGTRTLLLMGRSVRRRRPASQAVPRAGHRH